MTRLSWLAILTFTFFATATSSPLAAAEPSAASPAIADTESDEAAIGEGASEDRQAGKDQANEDDKKGSGKPAAADTAEAVEFFSAMNDGQVDVTFIARSDHAARLIITNNTKQPITLRMPEAFAGVPVVAQFGGGGGGRGGGGGGRGGGVGGGGGGQQSVGGGGGMMGGGGGGGGMGGGMFSVPPEQTKKLNFPVVCLDHGLRDPSSSKEYRIVPADEHVAQPAVVELLKAFGHGKLQHGAAQAAAWNLNSNVSWNDLAAKRQGTVRTPSRQPYFTAQEMQAAMAYAHESARLAEQNAEEYRDFGKAKEEDRYSDENIEEEEVSSISTEDLSATK